MAQPRTPAFEATDTVSVRYIRINEITMLARNGTFYNVHKLLYTTVVW